MWLGSHLYLDAHAPTTVLVKAHLLSAKEATGTAGVGSTASTASTASVASVASVASTASTASTASLQLSLTEAALDENGKPPYKPVPHPLP